MVKKLAVAGLLISLLALYGWSICGFDNSAVRETPQAVMINGLM